MASLDDKAAIVAAYIQAHPDILTDGPEIYDHMGAILTDAFLQSGINYRNVVEPRVRRIKAQADAKTTSGFLRMLRERGPEKLIDFPGRKAGWVLNIAEFFDSENVQTAEELKIWLEDPANLARLLQQKGCGPKTRDYIQSLVGIQTVAIDKHLQDFLSGVGVPFQDYAEAQEIFHWAADILKIKRSRLDFSIWSYQSSKSK